MKNYPLIKICRNQKPPVLADVKISQKVLRYKERVIAPHMQRVTTAEGVTIYFVTDKSNPDSSVTANVYVIMGELSNQAAVMRTKDIDDVIATPECSFIKIIDKQTSNWQPRRGPEPDDQLAVDAASLRRRHRQQRREAPSARSRP